MTDSKLQRQRDLEEHSLNLGIARYRKAVAEKDLSEMRPGQHLLNRMITPLVEAIDNEKATMGKAKRGKPSIYGQYIAGFNSEVQAYVVSRVVINALTLSTPAKLNGLSIRVATMLEEHQQYFELRCFEPNLYNAMERKAKKATTSRHSRAVMNTAASTVKEKHNVIGLEWTERDKMVYGSKLIELFVTTKGLAKIEERRQGKKRSKVVVATPKTLEWLEKQHGNCELLTPMNLPMVIPPKPWTQPIGGGYLGEASVPKLRMIKTRDKDTIDEYFSTDMPDVYNAVNAIQNTAWRINKSVLNVIDTLSKSNSTLGGLPTAAEMELPPRPADIDTNEVARREWRANAARRYAAHARSTSKKISLTQQLYIAKLLKDDEELYFPHQLDFRGRIYPIPSSVNPQSDDVGKSLLEFSEGKPLGETGAFWLAVHLANSYGFDKASLEDRVEWVWEHEELILDAALNPLDGRRWWIGADKPFCFLAACFEWAGYKVEGDSFKSRTPIAMDGSCSGLQHYSALLKDSVGGGAVNLVPGNKPADIYTTVACRVSEELYSRTDRGDKLAEAWAGKVVRKIVKQPCMTYAYSATARGMRDQIADAMSKLDITGNYIPGYTMWEAANYLAPIIRDCIRDTVIAASAAMDWLQDAIKQLSAKQLPCIWITPVGLPVIQREVSYKGKRVDIMFEGKRVQLTYAISSKKINGRKQVSAIAPNYIHSMDAAHLMRTVLGCKAQGIDDFAMVHDSFGTHACDVDALNLILRESFVEMYEVARLEEFKAHAEELLGEELPPIPAVGDLELAAVEDSDFFFA